MGQRFSELKRGSVTSAGRNRTHELSRLACNNIVSNMSCKKDISDGGEDCEEALTLENDKRSEIDSVLVVPDSIESTGETSAKCDSNSVDNTKYESVMPKKLSCEAGKSNEDLAGARSVKPMYKKTSWPKKLNCKFKCLQETKDEIPHPDVCEDCVCTGYRKVTDQQPESEETLESEELLSTSSVESSEDEDIVPVAVPVIDLSKFRPEDYPTEDCDERARQERAREMEQGIEPPPDFDLQQMPITPYQGNGERRISLEELNALLNTNLGLNPLCSISGFTALNVLAHLDIDALTAADFAHVDLLGLPIQCLGLEGCGNSHGTVHTQVDYIHCLVPDLLQINNCSFYWGKMDRYEAEKLLENKPEGTFLLRDSAQEEYLFSVSFRRYGRSLHARIEQWDHKFSFDSHDPGVFSSTTVCGLIEHYKDPTCCMFFEPMLTIPLHRNFVFNMQHLCRSVICSNITYNSINGLQLPKSLKNYLKEYHYKQRIRVRRLDSEM